MDISPSSVRVAERYVMRDIYRPEGPLDFKFSGWKAAFSGGGSLEWSIDRGYKQAKGRVFWRDGDSVYLWEATYPLGYDYKDERGREKTLQDAIDKIEAILKQHG